MAQGRRLALAATVPALVLIGAALAAPSGALSQPRPTCTAATLRLDFAGGQAATSHRFWNFSLRNVGPSTCQLKGFPRIALLDGNAKRIKDTVLNEAGFNQQTVTLGPWQAAYFTFSYAVSAPCLPNFFYAYGLAVTPPGSNQRLVYYRGRFDVCGASVTHPRVYPVRAKLGLP